MAKTEIVVKGARMHNLKNVGINVPHNSFCVFTGVSGSGKSSLAFDTIFAEGQRRFIESLSSYARQFLGQMNKPDVDFIEGLSPAVSIDQKSTNRNPRSTVGTITEIYDYLRLLYARIGIQHCPICLEPVRAQTVEQIVKQLMELPEKTRFMVLSPVVRDRKGEYQDQLRGWRVQGFSRAKIDGVVRKLDDDISLAKTMRHNIDIVVDRISMNAAVQARLTASVETSLELSKGRVLVEFIDVPENDPGRFHKFSSTRACPNDHELELDDIEPRTFSFNAPFGACPQCTGVGYSVEIDPEMIVPNPKLSILAGAIEPWNGSSSGYYNQVLAGLADELSFNLNDAWKDLPQNIKNTILYGKEDRVSISFRTRWGRIREYSTEFEGVINLIKRRYEETESSAAKEKYEQYMRQVPCTLCDGKRLKPEVLAVRIMDKSISDITEFPINDLLDWMSCVKVEKQQEKIAAPILKEINERLTFLVAVGLNYLTLSRSAGTLSGGEAQRIRLATQIGSGLVGVLYVLDEPSIGLHQRDNSLLIKSLKRLRDLGNTLIVVEHDEETIEAADWIVDIGPKAGVNGGEVVFCGPLKEFKNAKSCTSDYVFKRKEIETPKTRRNIKKTEKITVVKAQENNLQNVTVSFPLGVLTCVTGVSGSGKSSLVNAVLYKELAKRLNRARQVSGKHETILGVEKLDKIIHVDQGPIGRTPRSNPATYTGVWDKVRTLFSQTSEARIRGWGPGRFSFNVAGGRCEACAGDGTLKIEMNFLPDVYVKCETCNGTRYNSETLYVQYKGKTVDDVLNMTISEAVEFFKNVPSIHRYIATLEDVGLGYIKLGQSSTTLSGGESQRVKLATELQRKSTGRTLYVLDEPTTGLHFDDVKKLLLVLQRLVDQGNTVIVIEHNLDVVKSADWVIDLGPEGGAGGGKVIAEGTPEKVASTWKKTGSSTGQYLAKILN
ncbi:MAG: excinuclease ABC subunit UvrA [Candidatus Ancillula sp.]|jgi:excinuclease ABC subunit A|nr:excinuclease ABC subunit UvrA [Candidatus Ancillula sp.]